MSVDNNLRELRDAAGLTQIALAVKAGCSASTISAVEKYGYPPSMSMRQRIARALHVKLEDVWPRDEVMVA
jgi:putative transcriptional regulator